jgi:hypothetical protein
MSSFHPRAIREEGTHFAVPILMKLIRRLAIRQEANLRRVPIPMSFIHRRLI